MSRTWRTLVLLIVLSGIALLHGVPVPSAATGSVSSSWTIVDNTPAQGGLGQAVLGLNDSIYIVREASGKLDIWLWSPNNPGNFSNQPTPSASFQNGTALTWDGERFIYGLFGRFTSANSPRKVFKRYDTCMGQPSSCTQTWSSRANTPRSQGAGDALTFVVKEDTDLIYAFTGNEDTAGDFARYDVAQNSWIGGLGLPSGWTHVDDGASLAWDGSEERGARYIYALHGSNRSDTATTDFARYDLKTQNWEPRPSIPTAVDDGGSLIWDGKNHLYAITGGAKEKEGLSGTKAYRFDLDAQNWQELPDLPCPVGHNVGNRLAYIDGTLYAWQGAPSTWQCNGDAIMRIAP